MISYELIGLKEHSIYVAFPDIAERQSEFSIKWHFGIDIERPATAQIAIVLDVQIQVQKPEGVPPLAQFVATHLFRLSDAEEELFEPAKSKENLGFFATLTGISLGSMRGLSYARTQGVLGPAVIMPVVNPSELLNDELPRILSRMQVQDTLSPERAR